MEDLKHRSEDAFQIFSDSEACALIWVLVFGCIAFDLLRQLVAWMFS